MTRAILLVALLAAAAGASAQQYKWVDKNGRVQYGDTPPPGASATALRAPAGPAAPAASGAAPSARKGPAAVADRQQQQAQAQEDEALKKQNCASAQEQLRMLQSGQRIMRLDSKGERYYLDEAQIGQESVRARQAVQQWCN